MTFDEYQVLARKTDKTFGTVPDDLLVPLLGLAGEAGSLLTLYKKWLRDGDSYEVVEEKIGEELGDILWYVSAVARRKNLKLSAIATANIEKTTSRWLQPNAQALFDESYPDAERLPRRFTAELRDDGNGLVDLFIDGKSFGAKLKDNAYESDGYRFHDVFHLAAATMLGWSPVLRALLEKKRKSNRSVDEVEDGGRAIAIEEGVSAVVFSYASQHSFFSGVSTIDWALLRTCHEMTARLEVGAKTLYEWEQMLLKCYDVWRELRKHKGGLIQCDLTTKTFAWMGCRDEDAGGHSA
jgi:NTP pyrophosphatase (non-canonical NTP hydrolase)